MTTKSHPHSWYLLYETENMRVFRCKKCGADSCEEKKDG